MPGGVDGGIGSCEECEELGTRVIIFHFVSLFSRNSSVSELLGERISRDSFGSQRPFGHNPLIIECATQHFARLPTRDPQTKHKDLHDL
jgi:hypothetical protein